MKRQSPSSSLTTPPPVPGQGPSGRPRLSEGGRRSRDRLTLSPDPLPPPPGVLPSSLTALPSGPFLCVAASGNEPKPGANRCSGLHLPLFSFS